VFNLKGFVYVLTNPSFKDDWVKIGKSSRMPDIRSKELFNTSIPLPFEIYATLETEKYSQAEKMIHKSIDRLTDLRINKQREFFNISPDVAYDILMDVSTLLDDAEVKLYGDNVNVKEDTTYGTRTRGVVFNFYNRGLKDGDVIQFVNDSSYQAIVANGRQVLFENELWYLSPLVRELFSRSNLVTNSGAYQGPYYFMHEGVRLSDKEIIM
jgi:hypothetical protein